MSVYFISAPDLGLVKIGFAETPKSRLVKAQVDSPTRLVLLAFLDGGKAEERQFHERFASYRARGEWFRHEGELADFIATLPHHVTAQRKPSLNQIIMAATGCCRAYASQMLSGYNGQSITIPVAVAVFRHSGLKIGPLERAEDHEIDVLEKFCGRYSSEKAA